MDIRWMDGIQGYLTRKIKTELEISPMLYRCMMHDLHYPL